MTASPSPTLETVPHSIRAGTGHSCAEYQPAFLLRSLVVTKVVLLERVVLKASCTAGAWPNGLLHVKLSAGDWSAVRVWELRQSPHQLDAIEEAEPLASARHDRPLVLEAEQNQPIKRREVGRVGGVLHGQLVVDVRQKRVGRQVAGQIVRILAEKRLVWGFVGVQVFAVGRFGLDPPWSMDQARGWRQGRDGRASELCTALRAKVGLGIGKVSLAKPARVAVRMQQGAGPMDGTSASLH